jgi:3alpha(or 20beta)-hydroxysteroid dehydrogenase
MIRFAGRVALVTGAANGIGEATVRLFAKAGARVVVADIDSRAEQVAVDIGSAAMPATLDVTASKAWTTAIAAAEDRFGPIGILVNNAGVYDETPLAKASKASFERMAAVNQYGPLVGIQAMIPTMERAGGGAIVNVASGAALIGTPKTPVYAMTKWGVRGLTRSAVRSLARHGIRINAVFPGIIGGTAMSATTDPAYLATLERGVPLRRIGQPEDVARAILFLASDEAAYISGAELTVDGGLRP